MLSATTRDFRWKVTGPNFHSLHKLFDEQRRQLDDWLDQLMAPARAVGVRTETVRPGETPPPEARRAMPAHQMIGELLTRHEAMARLLRRDIQVCGVGQGEQGTVELLRRLEEFHQTTAWMLRMLLPCAGDNPAAGEPAR